MMFDNSPEPERSIRDAVGEHVPAVLAVVGVVLVAAGVHTASLALAGIAAAHLVLALLALGVRRLVTSRGGSR